MPDLLTLHESFSILPTSIYTAETQHKPSNRGVTSTVSRYKKMTVMWRPIIAVTLLAVLVTASPPPKDKKAPVCERKGGGAKNDKGTINFVAGETEVSILPRGICPIGMRKIKTPCPDQIERNSNPKYKKKFEDARNETSGGKKGGKGGEKEKDEEEKRRNPCEKSDCRPKYGKPATFQVMAVQCANSAGKASNCFQKKGKINDYGCEVSPDDNGTIPYSKQTDDAGAGIEATTIGAKAGFPYGNNTMNVIQTCYVARQNGTVTLDGETSDVFENDIKCATKVDDWPCDACESGDDKFDRLEMRVRIHCRGKLTVSGNKASCGGASFTFSHKVFCDGTWSTMSPLPTPNTDKSGTIFFTVTFPKFSTSCVYDPTTETSDEDDDNPDDAFADTGAEDDSPSTDNSATPLSIGISLLLSSVLTAAFNMKTK